jgi:UDP:flavonoid glycosyltransferase YjiC (YdhE family)
LSSAIVFYISGHGYGHASRTIEVINAILAKRPEARVGVRTSAPRWLFDLSVKGRINFSTLETDTGVVQIDSLTLDEADSVRRAASFHADLVTRAASETRVLREIDAGVVVGDIPPLAFSVAASAGVPSVAISNFTWDWIYGDYPRTRLAPALLPAIRTAYAKTYLALRLPLSGGFQTMTNVRDIPFIARHATKSRQEVVEKLKLPANKPIVLVSFGGYGLPSLSSDVPSKSKKYTFVTTTNVPLGRRKEALAERKGAWISLDEEAIYQAGIRYEDLVAAADAVITKPGYGIVAESIANDTAILYTSRGHFPEYDVIVQELPKYTRSAFISHEELFAGKWEPHLDKLLAQPKPKKKPDTSGAQVAADILLQTLDNPPKRPRKASRKKAV